MVKKIYFIVLSLFLIYLLFINIITSVSSKNAYALIYPYNVRERSISTFNLIKYIVLETGIVALKKEKYEIEEEIKTLCKKYEIDPKLIYSIILVKSNFNPYKISLDGRVGLTQLPINILKEYDCSNPFDYKQNLEAGVGIINNLLKDRGPVKEIIKTYENIGGKYYKMINADRIMLIYRQVSSEQLSRR
jgi:hypothetical protein